MKRLVLLVLVLVFCGVFGGLALANEAEAALTLNAPNGGESWAVGNKYNITWTPSGSLGATVEYSTDSGATWNLTYEGADIGIYQWTVPDTPTTKARVRVKTVKLGIMGGFPVPKHENDVSDADFTIWKMLIVKPIYPVLFPPAAPAALTATASSSSAINLSWQDNSNNESGVKIFRKTVSGAYTLIKTLGTDKTTYKDTGLDPETQYVYKVQAYNGFGASDSNEDSATTLVEVVIPPIPGPTPAQTVIRLYIGSTDYYINDSLLGMDVAPISHSGRTLLPIKYVANPIGADITWDPATKKATVSLRGRVVEVWVGSNTARVSGVAKLLDSMDPNVTPVTLPPGRIMLPLRFIAENLGCKVDWTATTKEVKVTYPASPYGGGGGGSIL
ncbi:MAG TPA: hypothetical protein DEF34_05285 [Desulfotomaculum sp.]|nr:MAG: hypothetical protein VR67_10865 [Peptococcaceae bacterium BRH_c8a]KJS71815.1 MAG: hypothetical protein JL56_14085 [Desulfotomaculum sp. BICA1-6]HBX23031.1 hypothetical protein [Desulfotomaculum sp.]